MHISMPLAGMDPTPKAASDKLHDAERAFRMLSEGELFYVDTDLHEDALNESRHDHGHLGGVSLEVITHFMAAQKPGGGQNHLYKPTESIAETESTSRSSSQDTSNSDDYWQGRDPIALAVPAAAAAAPSIDTFPRISLKQALEWDYSKLEPPSLERRSRERSFSEPQLSRCLQASTLVPQIQRMEWFSAKQEETSETGVVAVSPRSSLQPQARRLQQQERPQEPRRRGSTNSPGDACTGAADNLQRAWSCVFGTGPGSINYRQVVGISRHLSSCTSTKTFEVSSDGSEREALARLGVVPDTTHRLGGAGSVTFTMHIAGHRVVSTIFGKHAEYEVRLKGGGRRWSRWQRFSKFKMIASCVEKDASSMTAWKRVLRAKPHYRCLDMDYLSQKCNLLEVFLQQVMFAMPTPALLIHFVSSQK